MRNYDAEFLKTLDKARVKTHYARITLLSFSEKPITEIQGKITSGNISVNGSSAIRRTISLSMAIDNSLTDITNIENQISINKKVKIDIGLKNPFPKTIEEYGDIIWFPQGIYVLSSVNSSHSTSNWNLSITAKDKMCFLDGSAGGTLPATIVFHEREIELENGDIIREQPILRQIIYEAVNHYGSEDPDNIFINDLPDEVKMLVKYEGVNTIYFNGTYDSFSYQEDELNGYTIPVKNGEDAGYEMTPFTYPGELILKAGDTVVTLLDKIVKLLGNYEYFYDIEGHFIFQEIKNYVNKQSPLDELNSEDSLPNLPARDYVRIYDNKKTVYSITDLDGVSAISMNPKYDNIKNDFYVWGESKVNKNVPIRYHLSIDAKPILDLAKQYMYAIIDEQGAILRYGFGKDDYDEIEDKYKVGPPCDEWREELYRQALMAKTQSGFGYSNNYYYEELIAEWRKLYDPLKTEWNDTNHWNPDVFKNPENLVFWLDFIDVSTDLGKYSIGQIGRRTKVVNNNDIKTIYNKEVPDIVFIPVDAENASELEEYYDSIGQQWFQLNSASWDLFAISSTGASCYDEIRNLLYQHLNYYTTINITCLPIYYLDANNVIYVEDRDNGIIGNYQITQFTLPLTYNGTMSITAMEVYTRI